MKKDRLSKRKWLRKDKDFNSFIKTKVSVSTSTNDKGLKYYDVDSALTLHDCSRQVTYDLYSYGTRKQVLKQMKENQEILESLVSYINELAESHYRLMEDVEDDTE